MDIRDRITNVEKMRLGDIADNPRNPKTHPKRQGEAIRGVVSEIGWAGVPLIYFSERMGKWAYVDGHLRKQEFPELTANVAKTDLTDQEADYLLLTFDPIASLAVQDKEKLDELLREIQTGDSAVQEMLAEMAEKAGLFGDLPTLDDLEKEYGEPEERDFWPVIKVQVSPETKAKYDALMKELPGDDDAEKFDALVSSYEW
jgi:hypothetical protein